MITAKFPQNRLILISTTWDVGVTVTAKHSNDQVGIEDAD
jgi:hypothetical protein